MADAADDGGGVAYAIAAVMARRAAEVSHLLQAAVSPAATDRDGNGLLHWAAAANAPECATAVLDRGGDVDGRNGAGEAPLHWAAARGHVGVAAVLLSRGAPPGAMDAQVRGAGVPCTVCVCTRCAFIGCMRVCVHASVWVHA